MKIIVVCTGNSCRSQMAEGLIKNRFPDFEVFSAGTHPESNVNPYAVRVMQEKGIATPGLKGKYGKVTAHVLVLIQAALEARPECRVIMENVVFSRHLRDDYNYVTNWLSAVDDDFCCWRINSKLHGYTSRNRLIWTNLNMSKAFDKVQPLHRDPQECMDPHRSLVMDKNQTHCKPIVKSWTGDPQNPVPHTSAAQLVKDDRAVSRRDLLP